MANHEAVDAVMASAKAHNESMRAYEGEHQSYDRRALGERVVQVMFDRERGDNEGGYKLNMYDKILIPEPVVKIADRDSNTVMRNK